MTRNALILVDIQYDFLPNGALAVPEGDAIIPVANRLQPLFDLVVATQDWHPPDHGSFASNHPGREPGEMTELGGLPQVLWPDHCVQGSRGAELHSDLDLTRIARLFRKGTDPNIDSYSGFFDNGHRKATGLGDYLFEEAITSVYLMGLATDYCVRWSALDAIRLGFRTHLIEDGSRGVELRPGDVSAAITEVAAAGGRIVRSEDLAPL
jgi:nicotinamidase/pyrazinamidase